MIALEHLAEVCERASSISSSLTVSGGAKRSAVGVTALVTTPAASSRAQTSRASSPSSSAASSRPLPRTDGHGGKLDRARCVSRAPCCSARRGASMRRISSITATTADVASAPPEYVLPWSPGSNAAATSVRAQHAPTGIPLPIPFASVTTSGTTPACSNPNHLPGAGETGLHLVEDQQRAGLVAPPADGARGSRRSAGLTPPSPWIGSTSTPPTSASIGGDHRVGVVPRHVPEPVGHRLERLVLGRLARRRQRRQRATVEAAVGAHDRVPAATAVLAGQLDGALVGLGAGVGEEHLALAGRSTSRIRSVIRSGGRLGDRVGEQVADVPQRGRLVGDGGGDVPGWRARG